MRGLLRETYIHGRDGTKKCVCHVRGGEKLTASRRVNVCGRFHEPRFSYCVLQADSPTGFAFKAFKATPKTSSSFSTAELSTLGGGPDRGLLGQAGKSVEQGR